MSAHKHACIFQDRHTPCGFQPLGKFDETMPKSACWAGDYNAVLPTREPRTSQILHRITPSSSLVPCAASLWIPPCLYLLTLYIVYICTVIFSTPFLLHFDSRPRSSLFLCSHQSSDAKRGKTKGERVTGLSNIEGKQSNTNLWKID